jgi:hypothetical protein
MGSWFLTNIATGVMARLEVVGVLIRILRIQKEQYLGCFPKLWEKEHFLPRACLILGIG